MWPSKRIQAEEDGAAVPGEAVMESVEHIGQFVYEMAATKIRQLRAERGLPDTDQLPSIDEGGVEYVAASDDEADVGAAAGEGPSAGEA